MPVYAVFEVEVEAEPTAAAAAGYERYRAAVPALVERFGGRYLVRAGRGESLEGRATTGRWHLVEFPDADAARAFWSCADYLALKPLRAGAADVRAVLVEGPPSA